MMNLLHTEQYKFMHDKLFWTILGVILLFNAFLFSGTNILDSYGYQVFKISMSKEIATAIITCIYGGVSIGSDFMDRTLYHELLSGKGRSLVLLAKFIVFAFAANGLLFFFPFLLVLTCTIKNGWGMVVSISFVMHIICIVVALLILGFAISVISLLAAVCFRNIGCTIVIPIVIYFILILLLNSPFSSALFRIFPISTLILVVDGTVTPAYGIKLGIIWAGSLIIVSMLIFRRAELH